MYKVNSYFFKMSLVSNINNKQFLSLLVGVMPFSFMAGNMLISINTILLILIPLLIFGKEIFKIKIHLLDKIMISFFLLVLVTGIINNVHLYPIIKSWEPYLKISTDEYFLTIIKSLLFFKYLFIYFVLRFLIEKEIIDLKLFFIFSAVASLFVCFDIFYQFLNGKDIFGYVATGRKLSGPFGDELIAGGFVQRFSLFTFFVLPLFFKNLKVNFKIIIPFLFLIFFIGIILSGNRMPLILFILALCLVILFQKQTRKFFFPFIIIFSLTFFLVFNFNKLVRDNFLSFYGQTSKMVSIIMNKDLGKKAYPQYLKEFSTFYDTWLINKYIGGGIKNFRYYCHKRANIEESKEFICNMHPHNYYLEILTETGLVGFVLILLVFAITLYITFFKKYFTNSNLVQNNYIVPFIFLFIVEIFPIKSTGSFFTTGNATYLFLILGILIGLTRKENLIENQK